MPRGRIIALSLLLLSLVLAAAILTDVWPGLRGPAPETSEWYWPYLLRPLNRWWPALAVGAGVLVVGGWWLRRERERAALPLFLLVALNLALQLSLVYADRPAVGAELVDRTLSKASNGYSATAGEIENLNEALRHFPELMPTFDNDHARTHPPGLIVAHWLTDRAFRLVPSVAQSLARPATFWRCTDLWVLARPPSTAASLLVWSWLPPLLAALAVLPAYRLACRWLAPQSAILATLLTATLPALLIFAPSPDQIFAFLALLSLWWLDIGLREGRWAAMLASGMVLSLMTFLSLGNAAWVALLGVYILLWRTRTDETGKIFSWPSPNRWRLFLAFCGGASLLWLIYWAGWGVVPWEVARVGLGQHYELVTNLRRYDWWLGYNLIDFLLFAGPAVSLGLLWGAGQTFRTPINKWTDERLLAVLLVALLLAINIAGSTRGEVGRLWLVFMPAAAIVAGSAFGNIHDRLSWGLILAAQLIMILSIGLGWRSFYAVILPVEKPPMRDSTPSATLDIRFVTEDGREIRLAGIDGPQLNFRPGDTIETTLFWQSDRPALQPYSVFLQLLDASGTIVAQQDQWPVEGKWPPTCWTGGELVVDPYSLLLPLGTPAGPYRIVAGLYNVATGDRLPASSGGDFVELAEINVRD